MSLTGCCCFLVIFLLSVLGDFGCEGAPCPQFLPVAVRLDPEAPRIYRLGTTVKVKDEKENDIPKNAETNFIVRSSDLQLNGDAKDKTTEKLVKVSQLSTVRPETVTSEKPKKRRRLRTKEPKKIILNQNSIWSLKTINDKPAEVVLMTDKASVARDLQDSTESPLVTVKKLGTL